MTRRTLAATAALLSLVLVGCGGNDPEVASDPGSGTESTEGTETTKPTATPTVGAYPSFEPADYTYTLMLSCFCAGGGTPVDVTVDDGEVVEAVYVGDGRGAQAGEPADELMWLTINDVIDAANDTAAASVQVDWPAGQDYPSSVYVDEDLNTADEERGYHVSNVVVG